MHLKCKKYSLQHSVPIVSYFLSKINNVLALTFMPKKLNHVGKQKERWSKQGNSRKKRKMMTIMRMRQQPFTFQEKMVKKGTSGFVFGLIFVTSLYI